MKSKIKLLLALVCLCSTTHINAKEIKLNAPLHIDADKQSVRLKENIGVFEKNVLIEHGNLKIVAEHLETHKREQLGDDNEYLIASGSPVTFSAKQADGTLITASANEVTYDVSLALLVMKGNAMFQQGGNVIKADSITYDRANEIVSSEKNKNSDSQVKTIITTSDKEKK